MISAVKFNARDAGGDSKSPALAGEEWRPVEGFPKYEVSSLGRVRSHMWRSPHILSPAAIPSGHLFVMLSRDRRQHIRYVHGLVCAAWHGPRPEDHQTAHLDGDCKNNVPSNLMWATAKENNAHKIVHGTMPRGSAVSTSKLSEEQVLQIVERLNAGEAISEIATDVGVLRKAINDIATGTQWGWLTGIPRAPIKPYVQKLDAARAAEIYRRTTVAGERQADIAREFGVDPKTVRDIKNGKSWRSVTGLGDIR